MNAADRHIRQQADAWCRWCERGSVILIASCVGITLGLLRNFGWFDS